MSLMEELKRRHVVRVGIAYAIAGWLVIQVADVVTESFGAPDWVMKTLIAVVLLGFVIALAEAIAQDYRDLPEIRQTGFFDKVLDDPAIKQLVAELEASNKLELQAMHLVEKIRASRLFPENW